MLKKLNVPKFSLCVFLSLFILQSCSSQLSEQSDDSHSTEASSTELAQLPPAQTVSTELEIKFIEKLLADITAMPIHKQPVSVTSYRYNEQLVYYVQARCCDFYNKVYDENGNFLGSPDGGMTGRGDGSLPDFSKWKTNAQGIWKQSK